MPIRPIKPKVKRAYLKAKAKVSAGAGRLKSMLRRRFFGYRPLKEELEGSRLPQAEANSKMRTAGTVTRMAQGGRLETLKARAEPIKPDEELIKGKVVNIKAAMSLKATETAPGAKIKVKGGAKKLAGKHGKEEKKAA